MTKSMEQNNNNVKTKDMKKTKFFAMLGAIALAASGLTACSSSDDVAAVDNPNYNPETNEVKAQFVFNVATGNSTFTRQTAAATQATEYETFRGIDNAVLYSFKQASDGKHIPAATTATKRYDLAQVLAPATITSDNSRRVIETSLPLNTNSLLFYGKAIEGGATTMDYNTYGHLDEYTLPDASLDLNEVTFTLGKRLTGDNLTKYRQMENLLSAILTAIMNTNMAGSNHVAIVATSKPFEGVEPYGFDVATSEYPADLTWESYANSEGNSPVVTGHALYSLEEKLATVYREMTTIRQSAGEVRAGSGYALRLIIHDLWSNINEVRCAVPTNKAEAVAKYMANNITIRLRKYFGYTSLPVDGHSPEGVAFRDPVGIVSELSTDEWPATADAKPADFGKITNADDLNTFPYSFNLPRGAAHLTFDTTKKQFEYVKNFNTSAMDGEIITVEHYRYPAELTYFGNSAIRVSDEEKKTPNYPNGVSNWDNEASWSADWVKDSHVTPSTQSVAMQNDINYGTALLKTTVRYGASVLKDNNHAVQKQKYPSLADTDEPDKEITVDGTTFQLTGVIIGGSVKSVGWDNIAKTNDDYNAWVYDRNIASSAIPAPANGTSVPNYTLTFDNYIRNEHQNKVYVALEFLNNSGVDFFGEHNMVRNQSHFYLIGELDPEKAGLNTVSWPEHHPLPPYNADGSSIEKVRVFMQDYMTTADFVIGSESLKHAYLTVPDLRYSSLTLGLSVDIKWSTGLNFEDVLLGGN